MAPRKRKKPSRIAASKVVLIVGEGPTEEAFLKHIKSHYIKRNCGVSVQLKSAGGKCPNHIVTKAIRFSTPAYSHVAVLMDTDKEWSLEVTKLAADNNIELIGSPPCVDGLLLQILGEKVPTQSKHCKSNIKKHLSGSPTVSLSFSCFTKELLEERRKTIKVLNDLLKYYEVDKK